MIVRRLQEIIGTERDIDTPNWNSRRLLLANDKMGFSLHDTIIRAGTETPIQYLHHLEAVYCIEGKGEIETVADGKIYKIEPGMMYALNEHDKHLLRAEEDLRLVCVFNPAITGKEVHGKDGAYPPPDEA